MSTTAAVGYASFDTHSGYALRYVEVSKHYEEFALDSVSFGVPRGSVVGLIGRNGAGKTTLMKAALGIVTLKSGRVELFDTPLHTLNEEKRIRLCQRIAYVGAVLAFPSGMSAAEVAHLHQLAYPDFDLAAFTALCTRMGLDTESRKIADLSRGMGMKLQLACALASGAELLLLDEPTAGLDPIVRDEALDLLREWLEYEDRSVLISSHITSDLEHLADYLVMLEQGRIVFSCECDEIREGMGVAHLREHELRRVLAEWPFEQTQARVLERGLSHAVLVPDRTRFQQNFPHLICDRATIDDVMTFMVKAEVK